MALKFINGMTLNAGANENRLVGYPPTFMSVDNAIDLASKLNAATYEDWRYLVDVDARTGRAQVNVYDENGEYISHL
tara:strand:- start:188 stop:418 length:231 start_codon:yes stop_codon:yes gene_type:complete